MKVIYLWFFYFFLINYSLDDKCPLDYLETSIEEEDEIKVKEETDMSDEERNICNFSIKRFSNSMSTYFDDKSEITDKLMLTKSKTTFDVETDIIKRPIYSLDHDTSHSVELLDKLVSSYPISSRKVFSPNNVRCRTRNNPYINPLLKDQFQFRSFKCDRCNKYFKSQGYLKAHTSKVH